ncbi:MAG TPA: dihydrolipoyl dehydrogenase [Woeseiaceae bacterium]|jgi:dihydrolipoamide dehydrogenase|nr:dihydrolipoyl dehydrogenase [Woeseiaceae bacterium]
MTTRKLVVPDLGDFSDVEVIEVLVGQGDTVDVEDPLITLETEKASMDVPATEAGRIVSMEVAVGDKVSAGDAIATVETDEEEEGGEPEKEAGGESEDTAPRGRSDEREPPGQAAPGQMAQAGQAAPGQMDEVEHEGAPTTPAPPEVPEVFSPRPASDATHRADVVVIGAGPGGYTAAFRAADLGQKVILVERWPMLGGVCLNVGCIPSKALLHAAKVVDDAAAMAEHGIRFDKPRIDAAKLGVWKNGVVGRLTGGLTQLARQRKVTVVQGTAKFESPNRLAVDNGETIDFDHCIIAAGSESARLPDTPDDPRIVDSTGALELDPLPKRLLVIGGGIIGLEMACVYNALGTNVSVVELTGGLMPGTDPDLVRPFRKFIEPRYEMILVNTKVAEMRPTVPGIEVTFEGENASGKEIYDRVLVAVGRRANGDRLDAEKAGIEVGRNGIIAVDKQQRTNVPKIFAIGDLAGGPMLAHKATHEGKVAAEVASGEKSAFDARAIPSVAFTDPEIAWTGLTETDAKRDGISYQKKQIPWSASGRALSLGRPEGFTKLLLDPKTGRVLGGGIVGPSAGDVISEISLAVEMGADAADVSLTIHPHPTLSETVMFAAEAYEGTLTDLYMPIRKTANAS